MPEFLIRATTRTPTYKNVTVAKEDFCYTHYDGDEARDMTHMNRTERGAYTDIRIFQRKVGHLSIDQIKKVLSKDFDECWPAIELIMKVDNEGKYYIEWLENSLTRAKKHSGKQSDNGKNGGRPPKNKPKQKPTETQNKPNTNPTVSQKKPLGDGDEYEEENELGLVGGVGEDLETIFDEPFVVSLDLPLPDMTLEAAERSQHTYTRSKNTDFIKEQWVVFVAERIHDPPALRVKFRQLSDLTTYFLNWIRDKHPKNAKQRATQVGKDFISD